MGERSAKRTVSLAYLLRSPNAMHTFSVTTDELYVVAGHKSQPKKVQQKGHKARCRRLKGKRGRGTKENEKLPILDMLQRDGLVKVALLDDVKRKTIEPLIT